MVSSSQADSAASKGKRKGNGPPEFIPQSEFHQRELQQEKIVFRWIERGQMAEPKGYGQYWVRCRLCRSVFTASTTRAVEHFLKKGKPCPCRTGEVLHLLALDGAKIEGDAAQRMLYAYRVEKGIADDKGMHPIGGVERAAVDEMEAHLPPPLASGREVQPAATTGGGEGRDGVVMEEAQLVRDAVGPSCQASTTTLRSVRTTQTSIRRWIENNAQQRLDTQWGRALCQSGIAFNFVQQEETKALHELYLELGATKAKVEMPSLDSIRTVVLDTVYEQVKEAMQPIFDKWDISGCTLITDCFTDKELRPVLNFIAAGDGGAVLVKVVDMPKRKKNAMAFARLWEEVIREVGVQRVNAICTDNTGINKRVARILQRRADPDIARIPWMPCAAHTLSLLLEDIANVDWVARLRRQARSMVKFIKKHHHTVMLFSRSSMDGKKTLVLPTEVRFAPVYQMLERLQDRRWVLEDMMDNGWKEIHWSSRELRKKADKIYHWVRSANWWQEVERVVTIMRPVNEMLCRMDRDGTAPSQLWEFGDMLRCRLNNVHGLTGDQAHKILKHVDDRCKVMRQPAHAANFLLSPNRRDPRWLLEKNSPLVHTATKFFMSQLGGDHWGALQSHLDVWQSLWMFHCEPPKEQAKNDPMWDPFGRADSSLTRMTASQWWAEYGCNHPDLQKIATRVTAMWSTATPAEKNWSSLDLVQIKKTENLSSSSVAKLVYIHWNMQLKVVPRSLKCGFLDVWGTFFNEPEQPNPGDAAVLPGPLEQTEEEVGRLARLRKAARGRILKGGEDNATSASESSEEDLIWSGKGVNNRRSRQPPRDAKGKAQVVGEEDEEAEEDEGEEEEEEEEGFVLRAAGAIDESGREREHVDRFSLLTNAVRLDSDLNFLISAGSPLREETQIDEGVERGSARSLAERNRTVMQQRVEEDNTWRVAIPPPPPPPRLSRVQQGQSASHPAAAAGPEHVQYDPDRQQQPQYNVERPKHWQMECVQCEAGVEHHQQQQQVEQEQYQGHAEVQQDQEMEPPPQQQQQEHARLQQQWKQHEHVQQPQESLQGQQQLNVQAQQQHNIQQQHQEASVAVAAGHLFDCPPPFTHLQAGLVQNDLEISRAGRKRKPAAETIAAPAAKRGRGRPRKGEGRPAPPAPPLRPSRGVEDGTSQRGHSWISNDHPTEAEENGESESDADWW
ncbi:hypothetical protein CBR_g25844 [Chara braunii]|uniref:DUF659 domain-containing protein n=1 Tax=Chara braunii TaxID=69332 RepID=A0A388L6S9_CHABU|nr:hypothetical protein CBR_g25844 [Chara braunii]|eukprot:GBG77913.1 hypothetical protein CBR_g25844 [Chara braunii]